MQITSKGQVTIPQEIRNRLGLLPHTKVEFGLAGDHARIRKVSSPARRERPRTPSPDASAAPPDTRMSTDEILAPHQGSSRTTKRRK
jgi:AbrB family looped-hinge helix DNA binding protein